MIVMLHAAINTAILILSVSHIMMPGFGSGMIGFSSLSADVIAAAVSFAGAPFILLGIWALLNKDDRYLKCYYYYLIMVSVIGILFLTSSSVTSSCSKSLPKQLIRGGANGGSFFCTIFNVGSKLVILALASVLAYFTFIIWSLDASFFFDNGSMRNWAPVFGQYSLQSPGGGCCGMVARICGCGTCCGPNTACGECGACLCGPGTMCGACFAPTTFCGDFCMGCAKCSGGGSGGPCEACCGGCGHECGSFCAACGCQECDCCSGSKAERMPFAATSDAAPYAPNAKTIFGEPSYPHVISYPSLEIIQREKTWEVPQMSMV